MSQANSGVLKWLPLGVSGAAITGVVAWFAHWQGLLAFGNPPGVTMKVTIAISLALAGGLIYLIRGNGIGPRSQVLGSALTFWLLWISTVWVISKLMGKSLGLEHLFAEDHITSEYNPLPGQSATLTLVATTLLGMAGMAWIFDRRQAIRLIMAIVGIIGAGAVAGHIFHWPMLYGHFHGVSNGMAIQTAISFVLLGLSGCHKAVLGKGVP